MSISKIGIAAIGAVMVTMIAVLGTGTAHADVTSASMFAAICDSQPTACTGGNDEDAFNPAPGNNDTAVNAARLDEIIRRLAAQLEACEQTIVGYEIIEYETIVVPDDPSTVEDESTILVAPIYGDPIIVGDENCD